MKASVRIVAFLVVMAWGAACASPSADTKAPGRRAGPAAAGDRNDPIPVADSAGAGRCVEEYGAKTLRNRAFAFDGTIVSIESRREPKLAADEGPESQIVPWVTFDVNRWYRGGSGDEVGVWIGSLNVPTSNGTITGEPGTRLLVAGEPRWGGEPLDDPIAWACGFTQPYSAQAAAEWDAAFAE